MQKIKQYTVAAAVYADNLENAVLNNRLERQVNEHIEAGWQPYGPLIGTRREGSAIFAQPMLRYETWRRAPGSGPAPAGAAGRRR